MSNVTKEQSEKLLQLVREAVKLDNDLREQHKIGDKFRFIRDRLNALLKNVDESLATMAEEKEKKSDQLTEDEVLVYVYLFNAQGLIFNSWNRMVSPSVLYEYSVNRPIYLDKAHVEAVIRGKTNKPQHGFITIAVKKIDILPSPAGTEPAKDLIGNPVFKVREGSLMFNRVVSFTHQEHEYIVNAAGELIKKPI